MLKKILTGAILFSAAVVAVYFVVQAKPSNATAFVIFTGWMLLPYVLMAVQTAKSQYVNVNLGAVLIAVILANWALADIFYIHPDPQGAIAMFMLPPIEIVLYEIVYVIGYGLRKKADAGAA
ncbi:MAG: hypothetical protein ACEQSB_01305 [Undibacterium sp.]